MSGLYMFNLISVAYMDCVPLWVSYRPTARWGHSPGVSARGRFPLLRSANIGGLFARGKSSHAPHLLLVPKVRTGPMHWSLQK